MSRAPIPWLLAALVLLLGAGEVRAREGRDAAAAVPGSIAGRFAGERLGYDLSFLFFRRAAIGRLSLEPAPASGAEPAGGAARPDGAAAAGGAAPVGGGAPAKGAAEANGTPAAHAAAADSPAANGAAPVYIARLSAETKGFVGWINRRRHVYTSTLVPCDGGRRWCSRVFVKDLTERDRREVTTTYINPARGVMTWTVERDGVVDEIGREPIAPDGRYDDMLAALYNFRAGVYGAIERGRRYEIPTIPIEGVRTFTIRVLAGDEEAKVRRKYGMGASGFVIAVKVPRAIFKNEGEVFVWFSPEMVPLGGTVENYIGFGDVNGRLVQAVRPAGDEPGPGGRPDATAARGGWAGPPDADRVVPQGVEPPALPPESERGR